MLRMALSLCGGWRAFGHQPPDQATAEWKLVINGNRGKMLAAAAGDVNWMKYSGGACDEIRRGRSATLSPCQPTVEARSRAAVGRSSAVKHEEPAFIFIKRCLSGTPPAPSRAGRRRRWTWKDSGTASAAAEGAPVTVTTSSSMQCTDTETPRRMDWCKADSLVFVVLVTSLWLSNAVTDTLQNQTACHRGRRCNNR